MAFSGQCNIYRRPGAAPTAKQLLPGLLSAVHPQRRKGWRYRLRKTPVDEGDNNQSANIRALVEAGVRSFKIEGRYKEKREEHHGLLMPALDDVLEDRPDLARASSGRTAHFFLPDPEKTFHRGSSTDYFVTDRKIDIGAFDSPTFTGLARGHRRESRQAWAWQVVTQELLSNGDGLNVLVKREVVGFRANIAERRAIRRRRREALPLPRRAERNARRLVQAAPEPSANCTSTTTGNRHC